MKLLLASVALLVVAIHGRPVDEFHSCPQFWLPFNGYCYRYFGDRVQWEEALNRCRDHYSLNGRADLASIHSEQENAFLYDLFRSSAGNTPPSEWRGAWIGFHQTTAGSTGPFIWTDGSARDFERWLPNQPDNYNNIEGCAHLLRRNANDDILQSWNDRGCDRNLPYICKVAPN